jgi:hypothetical protein
MRKFAGGLESRALVDAFLRLSAAVAVMAGICITSQFTLMSGWAGMGFLLRLVSLLGTIFVAGAAYFVMSRSFGVPEASEFLSILSRKFGKK